MRRLVFLLEALFLDQVGDLLLAVQVVVAKAEHVPSLFAHYLFFVSTRNVRIYEVYSVFQAILLVFEV